MKILILGTSNSILRDGWVKGLRDAAPADVEITNSSIGASPGSQFAGWCGLDRDLTVYDYVVFDSVPNDENLVSYIGDQARYDRLLYELFATIAAQSHLIVLGFCNQRYAERRSRFYSLHHDLADKVGASFVSVIDYALQKAGPTFMDGPHIHPSIAYQFGSEFLDLVACLTRRPSGEPSFAQNFVTMPLSTLCDAPQVSKHNSLISDTFSLLLPGDVVDFGALQYLLGVYIDATASYGFIRLEGADPPYVQSLRYVVAPDAFLAKFVPVRSPAPIRWLTVLAEAEEFETSPHERDPVGMEMRRLSISRASFWLNGM